MNKLKELYSSPTTEILVVRFEGNILSGPNDFHDGGAGSYTPGDGGDIIDNGDF